MGPFSCGPENLLKSGNLPQGPEYKPSKIFTVTAKLFARMTK